MHGANKVRAISARTGANWVDGAHHNADDIVEGPKPGAETTRLHFVYDAWNRLRKVYEDDGDGLFEPGTDDDLLATYEYDGTGRRVQKVTTEDAPAGAAQADYYHRNL